MHCEHRPQQQAAALERPDEHTASIHCVRIVVLGDSGVGKTSIVKRFVDNTFPLEHCPTVAKKVVYPSIVLDSAVIECILVDLPTISRFPSCSEEEWRSFRHFGLRTAHAYLLVYDVSSPSSFQFLTKMRDQMIATRPDFNETPVIVAANKCDLGEVMEAKLKRDPSKTRQEIAGKVRKTWKASHLECSAKHNWNISLIFKELASQVLGLGAGAGEDNQACCPLWTWKPHTDQ